MKNTILIIYMMFNGLCLTANETPTEVPIYRAVLVETTTDGEMDESGTEYVLTMFKLVNSTSHPSSFTFCEVKDEEQIEQKCEKFFLAKQKEPLRCFASRFTAMVARNTQELIVDESMAEDSCESEVAVSPDELKLVWNVRTYVDGQLTKSFRGYPEAVR